MNSKTIKNFFVVILLLSTTALTSVCQTRKAASEVKTVNDVSLPQIITVDRPKTFKIDANNLPKPFAIPKT